MPRIYPARSSTSPTPNSNSPRSTSTACNGPSASGCSPTPGLQIGDWVLVHVGFAMAKIDEHEAELTLDQVQKMGADYVNEIEAFNSSEIA